MKEFALNKFFKENPNSGRNWLLQYAEFAINTTPEGNMKDSLKKLFTENRELLERADLWYSNDIFIDSLMSSFIEEADEITAKELSNVFIGKRLSNEVNATAHNMDPDYQGYLITFEFELEYQLFNFSEAIASLISFSMTHDDKTKELFLLLLIANIEDLPDQSELGLFIQHKLHEQIHFDYSNLAMTTNLAATKFVLAHEIGHHFLMHTNQQNNSISPFKSNHIRGGNINHEYEFLADEYALNLIFNEKKDKKNRFADLVGPAMTLITLAFEDPNPDKSSITHPSLKDRYLNIKQKMKSYCNEEEYESVFGITEIFLEYLHEAQNPWNGNVWWK